MNNNCFTRPNKPMTCKRPNFDIKAPTVTIQKQKLLTVDSSTECHTTPDDVAAYMVDCLELEAHHSVLEPHCGTGQLINALIEAGHKYTLICGIEQHYKLCDFTRDRFQELEYLKINQGDFLEFNEFHNESDRVICNPPFKKIVAHIDQVFKCLKRGGVAVCLVPVTYKKIDHEVLDVLPVDTFASCKVNTKIIKITR